MDRSPKIWLQSYNVNLIAVTLVSCFIPLGLSFFAYRKRAASRLICKKEVYKL